MRWGVPRGAQPLGVPPVSGSRRGTLGGSPRGRIQRALRWPRGRQRRAGLPSRPKGCRRTRRVRSVTLWQRRTMLSRTGRRPRQKRKLPKGSPCWTPWRLIMVCAPNSSGVGWPYHCSTKGASSGYSWRKRVRNASRLQELKAFFASICSKHIGSELLGSSESRIVWANLSRISLPLGRPMANWDGPTDSAHCSLYSVQFSLLYIYKGALLSKISPCH